MQSVRTSPPTNMIYNIASDIKTHKIVWIDSTTQKVMTAVQVSASTR